MEAKTYEAWWMPAHVIYRYVAVTTDGRKSWHRSIEDAKAALSR